jgi:hypothetical protein
MNEYIVIVDLFFVLSIFGITVLLIVLIVAIWLIIDIVDWLMIWLINLARIVIIILIGPSNKLIIVCVLDMFLNPFDIFLLILLIAIKQ